MPGVVCFALHNHISSLNEAFFTVIELKFDFSLKDDGVIQRFRLMHRRGSAWSQRDNHTNRSIVGQLKGLTARRIHIGSGRAVCGYFVGEPYSMATSIWEHFEFTAGIIIYYLGFRRVVMASDDSKFIKGRPPKVSPKRTPPTSGSKERILLRISYYLHGDVAVKRCSHTCLGGIRS